MDRKRFAKSREALLGSKAEEGIPLRSPSSSHRSSFDSDFDTTDYLDHDLLRKSARAKAKAHLPKTTLDWLRNYTPKSTKSAIIFCGVLLVLWTVLGGGFYFKFTSSDPYDGQSPPWYPTPIGGSLPQWKTSYEKAAELVKKMSLVEKVNVTTGTGWQMGLAVGQTGPAIEVGFPSLALQDGPLGIRFADNATAFPAGITVGATWNKKLMYQRGKAHGAEAKAKGVNVLLGPCVGPLGRMPAGGRNWEGFGSDPYLQGVAAAETIRGIQEEGVMATIKHLVGNEQEHFRQSREWGLENAISSNIDDRTLHELYLWPFADAVRAGVASVMCSYQRLNNSYACSNSKLLNGILKDELGFQGFVQSDWLAQRNGVASSLAGLDMTMPGDGLAWVDGKSLWGPQLTLSVLNGSLPISRLNDMVTRIVASWYQLGQDDEKKFDNKGPNFSSWTNDRTGLVYPGSPDDHDVKVVNQYVDAQGGKDHTHALIARDVAAEGTVLLKNEDHVLPLSKDGWPKDSKHELKFRIGIFGEDSGEGQGPNACPDRSCNQGTLGSGWGSGAVEFPYLVSPVSALKDAFNKDRVYVTDFPTNTPPMKLAPAILKDQDVCIVFVNADSGEGYLQVEDMGGDRNNLELQHGGDILVKQVAQGCGSGKGKTIVVVHSVGPVIMENWLNIPGVKAVLLANLPGQESGNALADVLLGRVNPSGKLPYTIGKSLEHYGPGAKIMYEPNGLSPQQNFSEGLYIDYRYFDKYDITPRFEFGYGLSYTTFKYFNLVVKQVKAKSALPSPRPSLDESPAVYDDVVPDPASAVVPSGFRRLAKYIYPYIEKVSDVKEGDYPYPEGYDIKQPLSQAGGGQGGNPSLYDIHVEVSVDIKNTGKYDGKEVAQLYLAYPGSATAKANKAGVDFPVKVLRGFEKVMIKKDETATVKFQLTRRDLSYWDVVQQNWVMPTDGKFTIFVGASSRDLQVTGAY